MKNSNSDNNDKKNPEKSSEMPLNEEEKPKPNLEKD